MHKGRLEAFSDGVFAIIITIMVLELKVPHGTSFEVLKQLAPVLISYVISFLYVAIYWNNHHHLFQAVKAINGKTLWANMFLLFILSFFPFVSGWMGENHFAALPVAAYCLILLFAAIAWWILHNQLLKLHPADSALVKATGDHFKRNISIVIYVVAFLTSFYFSELACALTVIVALTWLIPDKKIENTLGH